MSHYIGRVLTKCYVNSGTVEFLGASYQNYDGALRAALRDARSKALDAGNVNEVGDTKFLTYQYFVVDANGLEDARNRINQPEIWAQIRKLVDDWVFRGVLYFPEDPAQPTNTNKQ